MFALIKIIKENRLSKNPHRELIVEMFSAFTRSSGGSAYKFIDINSSLQEIERIIPFTEKRDEFENSIENKIEKEKYRSDKLQSIEKKYSDLENASGANITDINEWPLELAVYKALNETDELFIQDFISNIAIRHTGAMFFLDDIEEDLNVIASAINDYRMREYLRKRANLRREDTLSELDAEYKIFLPSKIPDFLEVEESLESGGFIEKSKMWKGEKNELIALIQLLIGDGYFKKQKSSTRINKTRTPTNFIDIEITSFFLRRYGIDLTEQRKPSYFAKHKDVISQSAKFIKSLITVLVVVNCIKIFIL